MSVRAETTWFEWEEAPNARFAVIGDPVEHSMSPRMQNAALRALGEPGEYVAIRVPNGDVPTALAHLHQLGYEGVNVTVPHKQAALSWCSTVSSFAQTAKAVNTIRFSDQTGINTDGPGFFESVQDFPFENRRALILGAGGSARAVIAQLSQEEWEIAIWNRTTETAYQLAMDFFGISVLPQPTLEGFDLIVQATSASLSGVGLPIEWTPAKSNVLAYDLMYTPASTPFLEDAKFHGYQIRDGRAMLVAQGALALEYWLGRKADRKSMHEAVND
jgi:shikimate dehydrogenase